jgi:hypothetical protein
MEAFYYLVFGALSAVVLGIELSKTTKDRINTSPAFNSFKNNYLVVYSLMMGECSLSFIKIQTFLDLSLSLYGSDVIYVFLIGFWRWVY